MQKTLKQKLTTGSGIVLCSIIIVYAYLRGYSMIHGIPLTLTPIGQDGGTQTSLVKLSGTALHATELLVNGREIPVDKLGNFSDPFVLLPGYNVITIEATDKFGHKKREVLQSYYKPESLLGIALGREN